MNLKGNLNFFCDSDCFIVSGDTRQRYQIQRNNIQCHLKVMANLIISMTKITRLKINSVRDRESNIFFF